MNTNNPVLIGITVTLILFMGLGEEISSTVPILFMGFNLIAAYMEYALIKGIESGDS